jgi:hypothetical protein
VETGLNTVNDPAINAGFWFPPLVAKPRIKTAIPSQTGKVRLNIFDVGAELGTFHTSPLDNHVILT